MTVVSWSYTVIMAAAMLAGWRALRAYQTPMALSQSEKWAVGIGALCGAMLGAKLPFALYDWDDLRSGVAWFSDGKTIVCGMVGAYAGVEIAKWIYDIRVKTGDSFAVPAALAVGIGRLSCFVGGCCYGVPTRLPWGVVFPLIDQQPRYPTQLYESAFHLSMAGLLAWLYHRGIWRGQLVKFYIMGYLVYRVVTEWIRPEPRVWLGLTGYQWFALAALPVFALLWYRDQQSSKHLTHPILD